MSVSLSLSSRVKISGAHAVPGVERRGGPCSSCPAASTSASTKWAPGSGSSSTTDARCKRLSPRSSTSTTSPSSRAPRTSWLWSASWRSDGRLKSAAERISRLVRLTPRERHLLLRAWCHLLFVDIALRFVSVTWLLPRTAAATQRLRRYRWRESAGCWRSRDAILRCGRSCLKDALVLVRMLRGRRHRRRSEDRRRAWRRRLARSCVGGASRSAAAWIG